MSLFLGDCLEIMIAEPGESVDLVYLDPPFFTQRVHRLKTRDNATEYFFKDTWDSVEEYLSFLRLRLQESHRLLKSTGSLFFHCDTSATHHIRLLLDSIFGVENFRSEIIWTYRRWSNAKKGLLSCHQTIYFYSKSEDFKFHTLYTDYSPTTNIDQILQDRVRDSNGKSAYKRDKNGQAILGKEKKGFPYQMFGRSLI